MLLGAHGILAAALGAEHERTVKVIKSLSDLYTAWHDAEPDPDVRRDYDTQAAVWRAQLPTTPPATQPTTQPAAAKTP